MELHFTTKLEEYYEKFIDLQEKLKKSEEERFLLEMKFNEMIQAGKLEQEAHYRKLRNQYKEFLEEDKKRHERNERILRSLDRVENRISMLSAKTDRVNLLRKQFRKLMLKNNGVEEKKHLELHDAFKKMPEDVNNKYHDSSEFLRNQEEQLEYLDHYLEKNKNEPHSKDSASIADDIMHSIHSRYYNNKTNPLKYSVKKSNQIESFRTHLKEPEEFKNSEDSASGISLQETNDKAQSVITENKSLLPEIIKNCAELKVDEIPSAINLKNEIEIIEFNDNASIKIDEIKDTLHQELQENNTHSEEIAINNLEDREINITAGNQLISSTLEDIAPILKDDDSEEIKIVSESSEELFKNEPDFAPKIESPELAQELVKKLDDDEFQQETDSKNADESVPDEIIEENTPQLSEEIKKDAEDEENQLANLQDEQETLEKNVISENIFATNNNTESKNEEASFYVDPNNQANLPNSEETVDQYNQQFLNSQQYENDQQYQSDQQYDQYAQQFLYDQHGQVVQPEYDENGQILPQYDENGQLIMLYDQNGQQYFNVQAQYDDEQIMQQEYYANNEQQNTAEENAEFKAEKITESDNNNHQAINVENKIAEEKIVESVAETEKVLKVMDILDTDTENSSQLIQNTRKVSNDDEDFNFS